MSQSEYLAGRVRELFLNGKWIAFTNYKELIQNLSWQEATKKVGNLNSIALLTFHINYYLGGVLPVFDGGELTIRDKFSFDMPPIRSEKEWQELVSSFLSNAESLAQRIEAMEDHDLSKPFADEKYGPFHRNIEGIIEHGYYHMGQIVLLKKMIQTA